MGILSFLTGKLPVNTNEIEQSITALELKTSAELRVVIEHKVKIAQQTCCCPTYKSAEFMQQVDTQPIGVEPCNIAEMRAKAMFDELNMQKTAERNGVLIYLSFKPHYIAIIGDQAIHEKVGQDFWQAIYQIMRTHCQRKEFTQAICEAITEIGEQLTHYFPRQENDVNELPNEVVIK